MRTTVNLPNDVYEAARALAALSRISLGDALGELARRGLKAQSVVDESGIFPCFRVPEGAEPITLEQTLSAEDDL